MFNFNKVQFDFNYVPLNENKSKNLRFMSLDDLDDEVLNTPSSARKEIEINVFDFQTFLIVNIFQPIGISISDNSVKYVYKESYINGETHYLGYVEIPQEQKKYNNGIYETKHVTYKIYIDVNIKTGELHIGGCSSFKNPHYLNINYPIIKICENYNGGKFYIGDAYVDLNYATKESPEEVLNKMSLPLEYLPINADSGKNISFYRCQWNGKKYYLPDELHRKELINIDNNLKLSSEFIKHLSGFDNSFKQSSTVLYYKMFESFEDFSKMIKLLCENDILVHSDLSFSFKKENYREELEKFEDLINEKLGKEKKYKSQLSEFDAKAKAYFEDLLPQSTVEHFESINSKAPNLLSTKTMFKERKSAKDPYRKLDLPVIKLILKDNGIDIDKIVDKYEQKWKINFYKFVNTLYKKISSLKILPNQYNIIISNILIYGNTTTVNVHNAIGNTIQFDILDVLNNKDKIELFKYVVGGLIQNPWVDNKMVIDDSLLESQDDNLKNLCRMLLKEFACYQDNFINNYSVHDYNTFILLQRFIYLFYIQYVRDYNASPLNSIKIDINEINLPEFLFSTCYFENEWAKNPFRFVDINMKMNTYSQLYKFLKYISYILENGYDIKYPYFYGISCYDRIFRQVNLSKSFEQLVDDEFNTQNPPNVKVLNTDSIIKMFNTIFTNIDKKI